MEIGEGEAVLEPMSGEKRGDAVNVAETGIRVMMVCEVTGSRPAVGES